MAFAEIKTEAILGLSKPLTRNNDWLLHLLADMVI